MSFSSHTGSADEIEVEMANESDVNRKFVTTANGKYEIMVQDKKGFFSSAIPARLPCCLAVFCCFMNCVLPGVGKQCHILLTANK